MELVLLLVVLVMLVTAPAAAQATITITSPANGALLYSSTLVVSGTATGAIRVEVCIDGIGCQNSSTVSSWSETFDLTPLSEGTHQVRACAFPVTGTPACATIALSLTRSYRTVQTVLESYVTPALAAGGLAVAIVVAFVPRAYRIGRGVAHLLVGDVIVVLVLRALTTTNTLLNGLGAAFLLAALGVSRFWRAKPHGGAT